ncbi:hypothetical protein AOLI_G00275760 [Acnodon oligacanthus]
MRWTKATLCDNELPPDLVLPEAVRTTRTWTAMKKRNSRQPAKAEEEAHVLGVPVGLVSSLESISAETLEDTAPPPQEYLTEEEDAAIQHLTKTLLDEVGTRMKQLLKAETVQITVADEAAAEATNNTMSICLEGSEEKHLDHLVSSNDDTGKVIRALLDILVNDALSASVEPLENEHMDPYLDKTEEETLEKHLDHLVSSNKDAADAIRELLEIMVDDVLSASLQPLEENQLMKISDGEANDHQTHPDLEEPEPTDIHPLVVCKLSFGKRLKDFSADITTKGKKLASFDIIVKIDLRGHLKPEAG